MANQRPATVAVTGAAGMLGREVSAAAPQWAAVVPLTRADGDLSVASEAMAGLSDAQPDAVVHCAAFTDVDGATADPESAWRGNAIATHNVARACEELGAGLVHISTDYVFDGSSACPCLESTQPSPINVYGETKLAAEREAAKLERHLIVRTQWLFGPGGRNFIEAILDVARSGRALRVVQDEHGHPTYTPDLARGIWRLLDSMLQGFGPRAAKEITGVVHLTNSGVCSRLEFAEAALREAGLCGTEVEGIPSKQWPSPTPRPLNAVLETELLDDLGVTPLRHWTEALREYVVVLRERWAGRQPSE